jgi:hypothetical protein
MITATELTSSENRQEFINQELQSSSKCWAGSPMESAFAVTVRKCTLIQRENLSKLAKFLIFSWKFLDLADEIAGIGAASSSDARTEQSDALFKVIKLGIHNLNSVCCQKVMSMLTSVLFDEFAFSLLKVLLNLSDEARNDVQLVFDDDPTNHSLGDNLAGFAGKVSFAKTSCSCIFAFADLFLGASCRFRHRQLCEESCRLDFHGKHTGRNASFTI